MRVILRPKLAAVAVVAAMSALVLQPREARLWATEEAPTEALRNLISAALSAAKDHDQAKLEEIARNLRIPNYEVWFKTTFGEQEGANLASAYARSADRDEKDFPRLVQGMAEHQGEILVEDAKEPKASVSNYCGQELLKSTKNDTSFYRASLEWVLPSGERKWFVAGYFTLVEGAYRRLNCISLGIFGPIRVGGNVQHARIIKNVPPIYPEDARQAGISGTVRLHAIIAKDGKVKDLELVSGHPLLAQAALDAVRQWTYQQTLLNGVPVEVDTTIDVIFSLNGRPPKQN